jgi:hypothetical protein
MTFAVDCRRVREWCSKTRRMPILTSIWRSSLDTLLKSRYEAKRPCLQYGGRKSRNRSFFHVVRRYSIEQKVLLLAHVLFSLPCGVDFGVENCVWRWKFLRSCSWSLMGPWFWLQGNNVHSTEQCSHLFSMIRQLISNVYVRLFGQTSCQMLYKTGMTIMVTANAKFVRQLAIIDVKFEILWK